MPKRKREKTQSKSAKTADAASPMPDPPASLIKLLQKDKAVLEYFTSLQTNLNLDVKRWKDRALEYRSKYKGLEKELEEKKKYDKKPNAVKSKGKPKKLATGKVSGIKNRSERIEKRMQVQEGDETDSPENGVPVESIHVPNESRSKQNNETSSLKKNGANGRPYSEREMQEDEESSLSDDSLFRKKKETTKTSKAKPKSTSKSDEASSSAAKRKRNSNTKAVTDFDATVGTKVKNSALEKGADFIEEDFFAYLSSGSGRGSSSSSSSSGSFGEIERELNAKMSNADAEVNDKIHDDKQLDGEGMDVEKDMLRVVIPEEERDKVRRQVLNQLIIAYENLQKLGVHLVDIVRSPQKGDNENGDGGDTSTTVEAIESKGNFDIGLNKNKRKESMTLDMLRCDDLDSDDSSDEGFFSSKSFLNSDAKKLESTPAPVKHAPRPFITRRSDVDVIQDIMRSIRSMIRRPTLDVEKDSYHCNAIKACFQPFLSNDLRPACYQVECSEIGQDCDDAVDLPPHPLVGGLQLLLKALLIMDNYCSRISIFSEQREWDKTLAASGIHIDGEKNEDWEKLESIRIGLMKRDIPSIILSGLEGEITHRWASIDRAARVDIKSPVNPAEIGSDKESETDSDQEYNADDVYSFNVKNRIRLFALLERVCLANLVSGLYLNRGDLQGLAQVVMDYIISATPAASIEDYPRYAPVMSFCVLEGLLRSPPIGNKVFFNDDSWFSNFIDSLNDDTEVTSCKNLRLQDVLSSICSHAASIWRQRKCSADQRVQGIAKAEVSAYKRLIRIQNYWLREAVITGDYILNRVDKMCETFESHACQANEYLITNQNSIAGKLLSIQLLLLWNSSAHTIMKYFDRAIELLKTRNKDGLSIAPPTFSIGSLLVISCVATSVQLQYLKWGASCLVGLSTKTLRAQIKEDNELRCKIDMLIQIFSNINSKLESSPNLCELTVLILRCCILAGDGSRAYKVAHAVCSRFDSTSSGEQRVLPLIAAFPIVRVINLQCREDRWRQVIVQSQRSQLLAVLAVAPLTSTTSCALPLQSSIWGSHAHNGKDIESLAFEQQTAHIFQNGKTLKDYVATHWRPSDLRTFDANARRDDKLIRTSVSERACALSHIASWNGVTHSLLEEDNQIEEDHLLQLFRISGFACGNSFLHENEGMPAAPVCIILEDDAVLVDQFNDRLATILKELPRDFHFCSIGYSRPKNAPMIHFSEHVGIPTCFWYLTGYIISLEGARYLLKSLPVRGPVDSWIGMKAAANWENEFGHRIGVGAAKAKVHLDVLPSRKQLSGILKFRVFAALTPLCSQRLDWRGGTSSQAPDRDTAKWRERDTDVTYSGCR